MFNIVIFGPPGAGKGTQSKFIIDKYKLMHLSTGDILRAEISGNTALGTEAKKLIEKGELVPDEMVIKMVKNKIDNNTDQKGFIFDGFPRTSEQAEALDGLLGEKGTSVSVMISLEVEEDELVDRLLKRAEKEGRADDNIDVIKNRIKVYNAVTSQVADYYSKKNRYRSVVGTGSMEEIFGRICSVIDEYKAVD
ncbi:MAG: adenylate kinase [Bacteroidales bacterium]|jgi:adenylate kinase